MYGPAGRHMCRPVDRDMEMVETVQIREVGPRDGFQNEPEMIATGGKVELIDALARTGLRRLEVTSFVRADVIPQLADAARGARARSRCPTEVACQRARSPTSAAWTRRSRCARAARGDGAARRSTRSTCSCRRPRRTTARTSTARSRSRWRAWRRVLGRAARGGPALRGRDLDLVRLPLRGTRPARARARDRRAPARGGRRRRSASATRPGWPTRARCASSSRRARATCGEVRADRALPQHARPGPRERARRARGRRRLASSRASASSAAARCRRARPATSPARISSRCSRRWGSRPASTCDALLACAARVAARSSAARWAATRSSPGLSTGTAERGPARASDPQRPASLAAARVRLRSPRASPATQYSCTATSISRRLRERRARGGVEHALGAADGDGRVGEQLVDERLRRRLELARARRRG